MTSSPEHPVDAVLAALRPLHLIRAFEEAAGAALHRGQVRGSVHQYTGQEAVAAGVCAHLGPQDFVSSHHRGHGHAIAKGVSPARMMRELFGREGGTSGGKGGSMHIADFSCGMLGANGVVPDGVTIATGAAHALKLRGRPGVVVAFFGDGAMNRGPLFEAFNWARLFDLPVLFVCEDNGYSVTLKTRSVTGGPPPVKRVAAFGIPVGEVDGNDLVAVLQEAGERVQAVRDGGGPQFLHARTTRWQGHLAHDLQPYRDADELTRARADDCIERAERWLLAAGVPASRLDELRLQCQREIDAAVAEANAAPWPDAATAFTDVQDIGSPAWR